MPAFSLAATTLPAHRILSSNRGFPQELDVIKIFIKQEAARNHGDLEAYVQAYKDSPDTTFVASTVNRGSAGPLAEYQP